VPLFLSTSVTALCRSSQLSVQLSLGFKSDFRPVQPASVLLSFFRPVTFDDVITAVRHLPNKSSEGGSFPADLLKQVIDELAPYLWKLFSRSLIIGQFPDAFKLALIKSLPNIQFVGGMKVLRAPCR
jgi:hypothetical protein